MKQINVDLYGGKSIFGGKEEPLVARYIHCMVFLTIFMWLETFLIIQNLSKEHILYDTINF